MICRTQQWAALLHFAFMGGYSLKLRSSPRDTVDVDITFRDTIEDLVMMVKKKLPTSLEILNVDRPGYRSYHLLLDIPTFLSIKLGAWMGMGNKHCHEHAVSWATIGWNSNVELSNDCISGRSWCLLMCHH
jgi:hypothetical protein